MIRFFPGLEEVRLISSGISQLNQNMAKFVEPVEKQASDRPPEKALFVGTWSEENFSISLKLKISNNFIPIIYGNVLPSEEGLLIRLKYSLFPATKKLLLFWTVLTLLLSMFFIGIYHAWLYGAISFGFCLVNYILARENFKIQVRKSKRMLEKLLS